MLFSRPISKQLNSWGPSEAFGCTIVPLMIPFARDKEWIQFVSAHLNDPWVIKQIPGNNTRMPREGCSGAARSKALIIFEVKAAACLAGAVTVVLFAALMRG